MVVLILTYTFLILIGSFIGYLKAGSVLSLLMGVPSALFLAFLTRRYKRGSLKGLYGILAVVAILSGFFIWRWTKTSLFFPGGLFACISTILLIVILLHLYTNNLKNRKFDKETP